MDSSGYINITRQSGLLKEMQTIANNIANISTNGYRREGVVFAEYLQPLDAAGGGISMATARVRYTDGANGTASPTGGTFDLALNGPGYFMVQTAQGERLTRAGNFTPNAQGDLVTMTGHPVLDASGAPIFIPPDATEVGIAADGTISANGRPLAQIGIFEVENPQMLLREDGVLFQPDAEPLPAENTTVLQGFVEESNVDPVTEMARMIEVQRSYELGQKLLDREDERLRAAVRTLGRTA